MLVSMQIETGILYFTEYERESQSVEVISKECLHSCRYNDTDDKAEGRVLK